ncbi:MAG: hypothetical protein Kow00123_18080 [Anaerolineales bacterium]
MSFDWAEYLELALELMGQEVAPAGEEARLRAAVSRAYYAAFCKARNCLLEEGWDLPRDSKIHAAVHERFATSSYNRRKQIGMDLKRLRADRNKADYDNYVKGLKETALLDIELSRRVLENLRQLRGTA